MNRREFMVATSVIGGGMALALVPCAEGGAPTIAAAELTPWIVIGADNIVTVRAPGPESGTGNSTQAAMFVAEELECDWNKVRVEPISFNRNTREGNLYLGATGIWSTFAGAGASGDVMKALMQAGASARERLRAAAAAQWKVPVGDIEAKSGVLSHARTKRQATYGELASRAATIKLPAEPTPKPRERWALLTKQTLPMVHARSVVDGSSVFGIDVRVPGMLYAALLQCPVHGGRLVSYDFEKIKGMPGVPRRRGGRPGRAAARAKKACTLGQHEGAKRHRGDCRALLAGAQGAGGAARGLGLRSRRAVENDPADL